MVVVVTFDGNGATPFQQNKSVLCGKEYGTLTSLEERIGYDFDGWYTEANSDDEVTSSSTVQNTAAQTLYTHWTANNHAVIFNAKGDSVSASSKKIVTYGDPPTAMRSGYEFDGPFTNKSDGNVITSSDVVKTPSDHTIYVRTEPSTSTQSHSR